MRPVPVPVATPPLGLGTPVGQPHLIHERHDELGQSSGQLEKGFEHDGLLSSATLGGFIHVLLVIAVVIVLLRVISGRKPI
jgi:Family of unknown function (DUF5670)